MAESLRNALMWLRSYYGASTELVSGPSGQYGAPGTHTTAQTLLGTLDDSELARPVIFTWEYRQPGYHYDPGDPVGWIQLYEASGWLEENGPALFIMQREDNAACQN